MKKHLLLCLLLLVPALYFRFAFLTQIPRGLNWDETAYGYNAFSIWQTGKDEWGIAHPLLLKSFGEYKPALLSYLIIPSLMVFSNWDFAARFVPALLNSFAVLGIYGLVFQLSRSQKQAFLTALLTAVTPWHIHFSRAALDPGLAFPLLIFGMWAWVHEKRWSKYLGACLLILSMYAYNAERVFVPIIVSAYCLIFWQKKWRNELKKNVFPVAFLVIGCLGIFYVTLYGNAGVRSRSTSFLFSEEIESAVTVRQNNAKIAGLSSLNFLTNSLFSTAGTFAHKYSLYFRPDFLFFSKGGVNASPILSFPERGNFLEIFLPLFVIGVVAGVRTASKTQLFFFAWLFLSPVAGGLTGDSPHAGRALMMVVAVNFFVALGVLWITELNIFTRKVYLHRAAAVAIFLLFALSVVSYWRDYLVIYPEQSEPFWQGYYKEMNLWVEQERTGYNTVFLTTAYDPQALLFYAWNNKLLLSELKENGRVQTVNKDTTSEVRSFAHEHSLVILPAGEGKKLFPTLSPIKTFYRFNRYASPQAVFEVYETDALKKLTDFE